MKSLRWHDHLSLNLFWLGLNIRNNALGVILMPYLVDLFVRPEFKNTALGEMRTAGLIIAMLVQPAMGLLSDRSTSRFGRRRPFIFLGTAFDIIFLILVALATNYWMLLAAVLLIQLSGNVSHGALQGLIPDNVPERERGVSSAVKSIMELLPLVFLPFTVAKLVSMGQIGWAVAVTCGMLLVTMLSTMFMVKEKPLEAAPNVPLGPDMMRILGMLLGILAGAAAGLLAGGVIGGLGGLIARMFTDTPAALSIGVGIGGVIAMSVAVVTGVWGGTLATLGQDARKNPDFSWWVVNRLMFLAAVTSIQGFAPYFMIYAFNITREGSIVMTSNLFMVVGLSTILTALPGGWLADKFGNKRLVAVSGWVATGGALLLLGTIWVPNLALIYAAGIILGLATGIFITSNWALGTELVPQGEAGRYLGISNLAGAGAGMIGAGMGGPIADYLNNHRPGLGYFVIFAAYALLFFLSVIALKGIRRGT